MKRYRKYWMLFLLIAGQKAFGQKGTDSVALVNEFTKLMTTTAQPYLYYSIITRTDAIPVVLKEDTLTTQGVFYKKHDDFYYASGQDEIYVQDSFKIQINRQRKTIWIDKIDKATKAKMTMLPVANKQFKGLLQKKFTINKSVINDSISELNFETRQSTSGESNVTTRIEIQYIPQSYQLKEMSIIIHLQEAASDEMITSLKNQGIDDNKLIKTIKGQKYLIRQQSLNMTFDNVDITKEKALQMPGWKDAVTYNGITKQFTVTEAYSGYTITKMF